MLYYDIYLPFEFYIELVAHASTGQSAENLSGFKEGWLSEYAKFRRASYLNGLGMKSSTSAYRLALRARHAAYPNSVMVHVSWRDGARNPPRWFAAMYAPWLN
eukprot:6174443-Pleurochrysis_carterae.AAC.4